jgi:hypothetical protein
MIKLLSMQPPSPADPQPAPFERFREVMKHILTVPKQEVLRREAEEKKRRKIQREKNREA